jgi:hypothetical protein
MKRLSREDALQIGADLIALAYPPELRDDVSEELRESFGRIAYKLRLPLVVGNMGLEVPEDE